MPPDTIAAMCHHYRGRQIRPEHFVDEFSIRSNLYQLTLPDAGFYPLAQVPIVRLDESGDRELVAAQWGFLPFWWKPSDKTPKRTTFQRKCFNARSEDVDAKPSFREAFKRRRCLVIADEFFEKGYYFHLPNHKPFAFAGLWERWRGDETIDSCTLLTTTPNAEVQTVGHNRMPVMLTTEADYATWLNPEIVERGPLEELLRPAPDGQLKCYKSK